MKYFIKNGLLAIISLVIGFGLHRMLTADLLMLFFPELYLHNTIHILAILVQGFFIFTIFKQILEKKISKISMYMIWICYFCILLFVLFIRLVGNRGINLNPFDFINSLKSDHMFFLTMIMNILIFAPLGYFFRKKTFIISLISIVIISLSVETIQYIFKLGIFDIDDILLNTIGFIIGYKLTRSLYYKSLKLGKENISMKQ